MNSEPVRHHYIPQFILKNFCFDSNSQLHYYNKKADKVSIKNTRDIFMAKNLYRDEKNHPSNPTKIEKDFANLEREAANIINEKFLSEQEIVLTYEENSLLMLFFALMGFRSKATAEKFATQLKSDSKKFYGKYQHNKDFDDLFKRNLGFLVNCRSLTEVMEHESIDAPFKLFMCRDIFGYFGQHIAVAQRDTQAEEFIITDTYPTVISGDTGNGIQYHIYSVFPITPDRILLIVSKGADATPREILQFRQNILLEPKDSPQNQILTIRVRKMHPVEVKEINNTLIKESHEGIAFKGFNNLNQALSILTKG